MILLKNINVTYPSLEKPILKNINLHIKTGEWVSLVGPSGSGKTSFLKVISGKLDTVEGNVIIHETDINGLSAHKRHEFIRRHVSTVYQQFRLLPQFSVLENIMLPLIPHENKKRIQSRARELIDEVGLTHRVTHFPHQLSGGEQQRVAFARALITDPSILLCDEPTGNLDTNNRDIILELLTQIHKKGKTIILATHDEIVAKKGKNILTFHEEDVHKGEVVL
ncbi:ATP-binding cassette domain-containing protein [Ornithinibacillus sp. L9]|uniref:ATP-binding cassette domain-containing protein n=1 Tax=Ornithinibacillus caprae TaxID=2678566 RepID=A0A6N8FLS2_9BACI|nr:ABC transporter ATP-binding protein [Ornithinibacillus caprae]MUK88719.1 ATP-binding cassette domain-containing protein [Ornithinibacillus caprae]